MGRKKKDAEKNDAAPLCPAGHPLERRSATDGDYECDVCSADISAGTCFFGCNPCDYSLCNNCYIKVATGELQLKSAAPDPAVLPADCITGARIDPDVAELCEHFAIEDRIMLKLNEAMLVRHSTWSSDMEKLWEELANARSPAGLLMAKIRQMAEGTFVGKVQAPKEVQRIIDKYHLDKDARTKLTGFICSRKESMEGDLFEIEKRLDNCGNPSAMVMMMIVKLHKGEKLPEPFRSTPHRDFGDVPGRGGAERADGRGAADCGRERSGGRERSRGGAREERGADRERRRSRSRSGGGAARR